MNNLYAKIVKIYFSTRNAYMLAKILLFIVVGYLYFMLMQMFFSKVHQACHNIANGIKQGNNSKTTDKHAADFSKAVC